MFKEYSPQELREYLDRADTKPVLLDVREPWEYERCHLPDSTLLPMRQIPSILNDFDPDQEIVVICHHGIRSRAIANYLAQQNFTKVINLVSGIDGWAKQVDLSMPVY